MHSEMKLIREKNIFTYSTCIAKTKLYMFFFRGEGDLFMIYKFHRYYIVYVNVGKIHSWQITYTL
jgi:hypothetical protein